jgi:3-hydroxyethyl bacteriochlorophyllide a dehydrogenase
MKTTAVVLNRPEHLELRERELTPSGPTDVVVEIAWSGISTGTERLLWSGRMPMFPGMGYPLVPGYESVGTISAAGLATELAVGTRVFVPGAACYGEEVRGLFGGAAARVVVPAARVIPVDEALGEQAVLLALAATALHVLDGPPVAEGPQLIVGHGVLGRLLARLLLAEEAIAPVVWETNPVRQSGAEGYQVIDPAQDECRTYQRIIDVSGDPALLDTLIGRLAPRGEIVLAGFYSEPLSFNFPPAFMREARLRVAAEWHRRDLERVATLVSSARLSLHGLITHREYAIDAEGAYRTAFGDPHCLKMILHWGQRT